MDDACCPVPDLTRQPQRALWARVITAGLLAPLLLAAVWALPTVALAALLAVFLAAAAWEWSALVGWQGAVPKAAYTGATLVLAVAGYQLLVVDWAWRGVIGGAFLWWCYALIAILAGQRGRDVLPRSKRWMAVIGWLMLLPAWLSLLWVHGQQTTLLIELLVLVWAADTAAYFAGRRWGVRRLASQVSPGKTWVGLFAALLIAPVIAAGFALGSVVARQSVLAAAGVAVVCIAVSIVGDLFESLVKRRSGVKDSGGLLPGHGGVLDRIDSLLAAAPAYVFALITLVQPA